MLHVRPIQPVVRVKPHRYEINTPLPRELDTFSFRSRFCPPHGPMDFFVSSQGRESWQESASTSGEGDWVHGSIMAVPDAKTSSMIVLAFWTEALALCLGT